jgi:formylglycine-generating enzyme required for sulfatase activity
MRRLLGFFLSFSIPVAVIAACGEDAVDDPSHPDAAAESDGGTDRGPDGAVLGTAGTGDPCSRNDVCANKICAFGVCAAPRPDDKVQNGDETDVDCGGTAAPVCGVDKACKAHSDCASDGCDFSGHCAVARSCTQLLGGKSCGEGEIAPDAGAPGPKHESCCTSLPVVRDADAGTAFVLDKYNITAGRMRALVDRTNGNVKEYITKNRPVWWNDAWTEWLPEGMDGERGVLMQLGAKYVDPEQATYAPVFGCNIKNYGARTYWMPASVNLAQGDVAQAFDQNELDPKSLNCVTFYMVAAFCAWDGGRPPTIEELDLAWNAGKPADYKFPWGNTPEPSGFANPDSDCRKAYPGATDKTHANHCYDYGFPARDGAKDVSNVISAPGRFPRGNGPFGHADLAGNVFNLTASFAEDGRARWSRSGSWEQAHPIPYGRSLSNKGRKYWAAGGRCVRDQGPLPPTTP